ncbi:uncharacterized protein LOC144165678 [Haemaphysalis longicornis]
MDKLYFSGRCTLLFVSQESVWLHKFKQEALAAILVYQEVGSEAMSSSILLPVLAAYFGFVFLTESTTTTQSSEIADEDTTDEIDYGDATPCSGLTSSYLHNGTLVQVGCIDSCGLPLTNTSCIVNETIKWTHENENLQRGNPTLAQNFTCEVGVCRNGTCIPTLCNETCTEVRATTTTAAPQTDGNC